MAKTPQLVIDFGYQYIKVLQVRPTKNGVEVVKAGKELLMLPPNADNETIYRSIEEILPILLQRLGIKEKQAIITLPGRAAFTRQFKIPIVRGRQLARIVRYEARQHIPFPLEQVNMDFQVSGTSAETNELEINLVAVRKDVTDAYANILRKLKIRADIIEAAPLSIYNAYSASKLKDGGEVTAIISIGASSTDIVIEQNGIMQFMRSAPVAGNYLTGLLTKNLNVPAEQAEDLKTRPASQYTGSEAVTPEQVASVLEKGFETIVTEIRRSFDFYVSQPDSSPVTRVLVCGGTANMEGVTEFLEDRLGVPVSLFEASQVEMVSIPAEHQTALRFEAPLLGMAVRAAGKANNSMSFAPPYIKQRLELERRAPMLGLMAFLLILMTAGSIYALQQMVEKRDEAVNRISEIISPGQRTQPELAKARNTQDKYRNRFDRINQVADKRGSISRVYLEIERLIPQDIWLESIDLSSSKVTVKGRALNNERITTYINSLSMSPFFESDAVALSESAALTDSEGTEQAQIGFTIKILAIRNPTQEEIKFANEFRKLLQGTSFQVILSKFVRSNPEDPTSPSTLLISVYNLNDQERLTLINRVMSALQASGDQTAQKIELRFHDRQSNWVGGMEIPREQAESFRNNQLSEADFVKAFVLVTPSPSPVPSPTPTPDPLEGTTQEETAGGYGGLGGYGSMGMGGYGGGAMGGM